MVIQVKELYKSYGNIKALDGISFYVEEGSLFAFLGTNGAGKSTTIEIISTILSPDSGEVIVDGLQLGKDNDSILNKIGIVFQDSILDSLLSVEDNLKIRASFYKMSSEKRRQAIKIVARNTEIFDFMKQAYGKLSGGQRRRVDIARALIHSPKILFLDEPTTGLDPKSKEDIWKTIFDLQRQTGMAVFLTTHYMEEATKADYITIINKGKITTKGTPHDLKTKYTTDKLYIKAVDQKNITRILLEQQISYQMKNDIFIVELKDSISSLDILNRIKPYIENFEVIHGSMEDVFLAVTNSGVNHDYFNV